MNSKKLILLVLIFITACGVKGPPISPAGKNIPSFINDYQDIHLEESEKLKLDRSLNGS